MSTCMDMIFKPSLKRRLVFTLLIGMLLIWAMLLAKDYFEYMHKIKSQLTQGQLNQALLMSIERLQSSQVKAAIAHTHVTFEQLNATSNPPAKGAVYFQWRNLSSRQSYVSHANVAWPAVPPPNGQTSLIDQRPYWPVTQTSAHWQLTIWHPAMDEANAITAIGLDLLSYIVWAFPVLLLLLMLAVWQGFKPLYRLIDEVRHRSADDFTALTDPTGYAELQPLLTSFNALLQRARRQREHEKQFYETVAHELKTPLAIIAGHAHVVATTDDPALKSQSLKVLEKSVEGLSTQINQLICLSTLSTPSSTPQTEVDLVSVVRDLLIDFMPLAQSRQIDMALDAPDQLPTQVNEPALALVLANLLKNAITHGKVGGRVQVRIGQEADRWTMEVSDDGPGLSAVDTAGKRHAPATSHERGPSGAGLGLAIVAQAVEVLKGHLTLGPGVDGRGLRARVVVPMPEAT
jgi:two-component system sensor histidine kinase QseC